MKRLLALGCLLLLTGCGTHINTQVNRVNVDGVDCIKAQSPQGISVSCDWAKATAR